MFEILVLVLVNFLHDLTASCSCWLFPCGYYQLFFKLLSIVPQYLIDPMLASRISALQQTQTCPVAFKCNSSNFSLVSSQENGATKSRCPNVQSPTPEDKPTNPAPRSLYLTASLLTLQSPSLW